MLDLLELVLQRLISERRGPRAEGQTFDWKTLSSSSALNSDWYGPFFCYKLSLLLECAINETCVRCLFAM